MLGASLDFRWMVLSILPKVSIVNVVLRQVSVGVLMSYQKVSAKVEDLCTILQEKQKTLGIFRE